MIKLVVAPYCHDCQDFDPTVKSETLRIEDISDPDFPGIRCVINTEVRCKYYKRCENIKRYLEKETKRNA